MIRGKLRSLASVVGVYFCFITPATGQTTFGTVVGTVSDTSGAVIPAAQVTMTSLAMTEKRVITTDNTGTYTFVNVLPGHYRIEVEKEGFKHFTRESVVV